MSGGVPSGALGVSLVVLFYSAGCLTLSTLLTCLLISFGESWTYVTLFSGFTALSTLGSVAQQIHYAVAWKVVKIAQFEAAVESEKHKGTAIGGAAHPIDQALYFIQFYCYNVMSLNVFFWTVALFTGAWGIRSAWLGNWYDRISPISKVFAVTFPASIVGLMQVKALQQIPIAYIMVTYASMFTSLSLGSILLILILYKYMKTRRLVAGHSARRGRWWASDGSKSRATDDSGYAAGTVETAVSSTVPNTRSAVSGNVANTRRSIYDRALVTRFSIGFVILAVFEIVIIIFSLFQSGNNATLAASGQPDFSIRSTITDIALFLPGATASLVAFLVFGTTKSWRQYRDLVFGGCGLRKVMRRKKQQRAEEASRAQGLEFERLPSLKKSASEEQRKAVTESENRVRMFAREMGRDDYSVSEASIPAPVLVRTKSDSRVPQFHRPMPSKSSSNDRMAADVIEVGISINQTVHYTNHNPKKSQPQESVAERSSSGSDNPIELCTLSPKERNDIWPVNLHK